ncbi:MAG: N-acetylmuramoyl-L-alanine amidase family protein [Acidimicrobiales bacterium]
MAIDPSRFAPGACVAYPPTEGNRGLTVFLDAGHGGPDPGAAGTTLSGATVLEKTVTLAVVDQTVPILRQEGFRIVVSRTTDSSVHLLEPGDMSGNILTVQGERADNAARARCADLARATALVSVHFNAGGDPRDAGCLSIYDPNRTFWSQSRSLASDLQDGLVQALNSQGWAIPDDGVVTDTSIGGPSPSVTDAQYGHLIVIGPRSAGYLDNPSTMPGAVIEPLFLSDPFEASIAASTIGQRVMAQAIAYGISRYVASTGSVGAG